MLFRVSRIIRELQIRGRENRYPAKLHRTFDPPETLALLSLLKEVKPSPDRKIIKLLTFDNSSSATTTLESFRFYCVLRTREPGSFWREYVIAVVTLPPGLARMSWWQEKVIKCKKLFDFAIESFSINRWSFPGCLFFLEHAQNLVHIPVLVLKSKALFPLRLVVERRPLSRFPAKMMLVQARKSRSRSRSRLRN